MTVNGTPLTDGEDEAMQSSPPMSSAQEQETIGEPVPVKSLVLVREEDLESRQVSLGLACADVVSGQTRIRVYQVHPRLQHRAAWDQGGYFATFESVLTA